MGIRWRSARATSESPLASIPSAIEYVSDPQVEPFALLTWAVTTTRQKSKKNPDLGRNSQAVPGPDAQRFDPPLPLSVDFFSS